MALSLYREEMQGNSYFQRIKATDFQSLSMVTRRKKASEETSFFHYWKSKWIRSEKSNKLQPCTALIIGNMDDDRIHYN